MKKRSTTKVFGLIVALLLVVAIAAYWSALKRSRGPQSRPAAQQRVSGTFDIGMVTFAGYAPLYLAKEKGFFGSLDVRLHRIEEVASIRAGMASGELEAYLATIDIALDTNARPPGVAVWAIDESAGGDGVVVGPGIEDLQQLKGLLVAAEPGLPPYFIFLYLLHQNGMSLSDVRFQDMSTQDSVTAFSTGRVAAAGLYEPLLTTALKERKGSRIVVSSAQTPGLIVDLIFVRGDVLTRRSEVETVIEGWNRALEFIEASPDEAYRVMSDAFDLEVGEFRDIASAVRWLDTNDNVGLFGTEESEGPLYENFVKIREVLKGNRPGVHDSQPEDHLTREFILSING